MMRSCGINSMHRPFEVRNGWEEADREYTAPDLLPECAVVESRLSWRCESDSPGETAIFRYPFLHGGLIREIMAKVGEQAGQDALYWQGSFWGYEKTTGSRLLIEQHMTGRWQGEIHVTKRGQAAALLDRLVELVERAQSHLGLKPDDVSRPPKAPNPQEEVKLTFGREKPHDSATPEWYVSYAWGDDKTKEGRERTRTVDRLCAKAEARGRTILRDKNVLDLGDSITDFIRRLGQGKRIFVIFSEKYAHSPYCMLELHEIWRTSRQEEQDFLDRVRILALPDAPRMDDPRDRIKLAVHWKKEHDDFDALSREHGASVFGEEDHRRLKQMQRFYADVSNILATLAARVQPRTLEQLIEWGLEDPED
ncbi:TIR domain-containing protein [Skermanella rosea]|uniref:TIR domain-containing protein n=1 Tax=Skermanella rosea TaxID=1817965 RepID=UPI00193429BD|nr:TIR domain-containing protein [Skermanella rosea]UEM04493.1 TIR domain-containing protein [Skermanella rosea]